MFPTARQYFLLMTYACSGVGQSFWERLAVYCHLQNTISMKEHGNTSSEVYCTTHTQDNNLYIGA